jgi:phosphoribosylamine--glycine ligase
MCGIIAVCDKDREVFDRIVTGLMALQHRGQDSCGIITSEGSNFWVKKELDAVHRAFKESDGCLLKGKFGVGHTRYATQGNGTIHDAQPVFLDNDPKIALAQNGNMINYFEIKEELIKKGVQLKTDVDTEVMLHVFARCYEQTNDFFCAAKELLERVKGGYAIVGVIAGKGMYAIRDPRGIRPLVLGKKGDSYMLASESVAFQVAGYEYVRDVKPGEAIMISPDMKIENKLILQKERAHCMFEWVYFASPNSMIEERSVYKTRLALGKLLSERVKEKDVDLVIPVPDSGRTCAIKLSEDSKIKYREGLIKNRYVQRTFIMASQKTREKAVTRKLMPIISMLKDKRIAVVDDSIVRGTTSKRIINSLKEGGVKNITFVSSCPPITHSCHYGIDISTRKELIAADKSIEEIRQCLGADNLIYATVDDIKTAIRRNVCVACLTGEYPVKISEAQKVRLGCQRANEPSTGDNMEKMNVLIIGSGGREHALALKVAESRHLEKLFAIPGNAGISKIAECHTLDIMDNNAIVNFAKEKNIGLVIIGPEGPLVNGLADELEKNGIKAFGPNKVASQFEGSKAFSRNFMKKYGLPSVEFGEFTDVAKAEAYIKEKGAPIVVKADGLAAGKGVLVAQTVDEAVNFTKECLENNKFGDASSTVVVEECLVGEEASYLVFMDSETFKPMVYSQDHKAVYEGDKGPNTGGMGAYSPAPILNRLEQEMEEKIIKPFLNGIRQEGMEYKGVLYVGLMKTKDGLKILEFNCRFGDPETQVIIPRLKSDIIEVMTAVVDKKLGDINLEWSDEHCISVVLASGGYPGSYEKGKTINGLDKTAGALIIHAGTKNDGEKVVTNGGRVLNVVCLGRNLKEAADKAYSAVNSIGFEGMYFRKDIGKKELDRQREG